MTNATVEILGIKTSYLHVKSLYKIDVIYEILRIEGMTKKALFKEFFFTIVQHGQQTLGVQDEM